MRILVTGAAGQLGYDVCRVLAERRMEYRGMPSWELDVTDQDAVRKTLAAFRPDGVINCAAYTKVDQAEDEPEECWAVNADGVRNLALGCREAGAKLLHISTDYVFSGDGTHFYSPDDDVNPQSVYGKSKLAGELAARSILEKCFIVRTSWAFGRSSLNFVKTLLRLAQTRTEVSVVCDQVGSPTATADLALLLCDMVAADRYGAYHATNEGVCSRVEFAKEIFRLAGKNVRVNAVSTSEYPARAARPLNSRMSKDKLEKMGFHRLPPWQDALERYLKKEKTGEG